MTKDKSISLSSLSQISCVVLAVIASTAALSLAKNVLVPLALALFIYALLSPGMDYVMNRWNLNKPLTLGIGIMFYLIIGMVGIFLSVSSIRNFVIESQSYQEKFQQVGTQIQNFANNLGFSTFRTDWIEQIGGSKILDVGRLLTGNVLDWIGFWVLVSIYLLFLFSGKTQSEASPEIIQKVQKSISKYAWVKGSISLITATLVGIVLVSVGSDLVFFFAFLTLVLNFIPSLGSIIATLIPLPILWLQFGFGINFVVALVLMAVIQVTMGNIIEPKLMGKTLNLHPVTVMFFLIFWSFVWGIPGAFMSVPLTVIMHMTLSRIEVTKPIAELMSGNLRGIK